MDWKETMKQKMRKPRNTFAVLAIKRRAGSHTKPYKSLRKKEKQDGWDG